MTVHKTILWALGLMMCSLLIHGCSDSSSSANNQTVEASYPFGAESTVYTVDTDSDGNWDIKTTKIYTYNDEMTLVEQTTSIEWDRDADGVTDELKNKTVTYDPEIINDTSTMLAAKALSNNLFPGVVGTPTSEVVEEYVLDEENGRMFDHCTLRSICSYTYSPKGLLLEQTERVVWDHEPDGEANEIREEHILYNYDKNDNQTLYHYRYSIDYGGDRSIDHTREYKIQDSYDENGNLTNHTKKEIYGYDDEGTLQTRLIEDLTSDHSYVDGKLVQTIDTVPGITSTTTYTYNDSNQLLSKHQISDWLKDDIVDALFTTTFVYDDADHIISEQYHTEQYNSDDGQMNSQANRITYWTYTPEGLLETTTSEYSSGKTVYRYSYEAGRPTLSVQENYSDSDLDGTFDFIHRTQQYLYNYEDGYLTDYQFDDVYDDDNNDSSHEDSHKTTTSSYSYSNGNLDEFRDTEYKSTRLVYDEAGLLTDHISEIDSDHDGIVDSVLSYRFIYNEDQTVTVNSTSTHEGSAKLQFTLDFSGQPFPVGNIDQPEKTLKVAYPSTIWHTPDAPGGGGPYNREYKYYEMNVPIPKIYALLINSTY